MGQHLELNTMFRLSQNDPQPNTLIPGTVFKTTKTNLRIYPVGLPLMLLTEDWQVLGYCSVKRSEMNPEGMNLEIEIISRFNNSESEIHTAKVIEALTKTKYLPRSDR
jgi:hypothetical protein